MLTLIVLHQGVYYFPAQAHCKYVSQPKCFQNEKYVGPGTLHASIEKKILDGAAFIFANFNITNVHMTKVERVVQIT